MRELVRMDPWVMEIEHNQLWVFNDVDFSKFTEKNYIRTSPLNPLTYSGVVIWGHWNDLVIELPLDSGGWNSKHLTLEMNVHPTHGYDHGGGGHLHDRGN